MTCDDSFGTRAPISGGTALGSGTSTVTDSRTLSSLTEATTYYYCALANNSVGTSTGSIVSFTTLPVAPTNLIGTASSPDVILNWSDNSSSEDGYNIWRSSDGVNYASIATTSADAISYTDAGLGSGTWYHKVKAFKGTTYSLFSNPATTTLP